MPEPYGIARLSPNGLLSQADLRLFRYTLEYGGLGIVRSDTSFSLVAHPFRRDSLANLVTVLPDKALDPIPLAFASYEMVKRYVKLSPSEDRLIDMYSRAPLTLVCEIRDDQDPRAVGEMLNTEGTIGVRLTDSPIEMQISNELQRPITTCAIRDEAGRPVRSFDDAYALVRSRIESCGDRILFYSARANRFAPSDLSTVVSVRKLPIRRGDEEEVPDSIHVYRIGALEPKKINDALRVLCPSDFEDWT